MSDFIPATTGLSRVFIIEGRARPDHMPEFNSCMRGQALSKSFGDVTDIECPDPNRPGAYVKIGEIQAGDERATMTLEGRMAIDARSRLLQLAQRKCPLDVQLHFGDCEDLSDRNNYKKILFLEDARLASFDTEDLGSLQSADTTPINESVEISATRIYDIIRQVFAQEGEDIVTLNVLDVVFCDEPSCGNCADDSAGCEKIYAITVAESGSPGVPPSILWSLDGGLIWDADDITPLAADDPNAIACVSGYLVVISHAANLFYFTLQTNFNLGAFSVPWLTSAAAAAIGGFNANGAPHDIVSVGTKAWIVGNNGYIYVMRGPAAGVTVQSAGETTAAHLVKVDALNENRAVAVGGNATVVFTTDGETWEVTQNNPVDYGTNLVSVVMKSNSVWFVGDEAGFLWFTTDSGVSWSLNAFEGDGVGQVIDITFATDSIGYFIHDTGAIGLVFATFNGGYDWVPLPLGAGILPDTVGLAAIAACKHEPELVIAVGEGEALDTDGIIIRGSM
jgi:photosystem II stability/assembly factor-like uncharacterized protein